MSVYCMYICICIYIHVGKLHANIRMITHFEMKDLGMRLACKWRNGYEAELLLCPSFGIIFK